MKSSFLPCSLYAFALSVLIFSSWFSYAALDLFLATPYLLGTHTEDWMNWHAMGCFFVGLINLRALRWKDTRARRDTAAATAVIFGVWALQNARLLYTGRFLPLMWLHVIGCAAAAAWSIACAVSVGSRHAAVHETHPMR